LLNTTSKRVYKYLYEYAGTEIEYHEAPAIQMLLIPGLALRVLLSRPSLVEPPRLATAYCNDPSSLPIPGWSTPRLDAALNLVQEYPSQVQQCYRDSRINFIEGAVDPFHPEFIRKILARLRTASFLKKEITVFRKQCNSTRWFAVEGGELGYEMVSCSRYSPVHRRECGDLRSYGT
jgi:hypothetical protein